jgi:hypothetical protein
MEVNMNCERCSGQMTYESFYGWESSAVWFYPGWRCIHCGEVVDRVIYLNRRLNSQHFWKSEEVRSETPALLFGETIKMAEMSHSVYAAVGEEVEEDF